MKQNVLQITAYLVIIAAGMKAAAPIINTILLAVLLSISIMPAVIWLMKKGVPKVLTLLITIFAIVISTLLIGSILSVAVVGIADKMPEYEAQLSVFKTDII